MSRRDPVAPATYRQMKRVNLIREQIGKPPIDLDDSDWTMTVEHADEFIREHREPVKHGESPETESAATEPVETAEPVETRKRAAPARRRRSVKPRVETDSE